MEDVNETPKKEQAQASILERLVRFVKRRTLLGPIFVCISCFFIPHIAVTVLNVEGSEYFFCFSGVVWPIRVFFHGNQNQMFEP